MRLEQSHAFLRRQGGCLGEQRQQRDSEQASRKPIDLQHGLVPIARHVPRLSSNACILSHDVEPVERVVGLLRELLDAGEASQVELPHLGRAGVDPALSDNLLLGRLALDDVPHGKDELLGAHPAEVDGGSQAEADIGARDERRAACEPARRGRPVERHDGLDVGGGGHQAREEVEWKGMTKETNGRYKEHEKKRRARKRVVFMLGAPAKAGRASTR